MAVDENKSSTAINSDFKNVTAGRDIIFIISEKIAEDKKVVFSEQQAAEAFDRYADKYQSRYGLIRLLGMSKGVSLESVYTPVRFLSKLSIRQFETIEGLEKIYRDKNKRRLQSGKCLSKDGITVAKTNQYLMVLGNPGAGKSTFLRRMGLEAFKGKTGIFYHNYIPVLLELKQFNNKKVDLIAAITEEFKYFGFPPSPEFVTKALEEGNLLVLLDGLDEVPKEFTNSVMKEIDNFVTEYEQNRFIASCRIAAYRSNLQHDFQVIELADFNDNQIKQFIDNWFSSELDKQTKTAEKCWEALNQDNNKAAKELAQTPLLLTFLCLVYNRKQSFPPTRSRLYNKALDILLEEWAAEKRIQQEDIYQGLHTDLEKVMLAKIAYQAFVTDQLFFQKQKLVDSIKDFLADTVDNPKYLDGQKILNAIAAQQGILVERAEDIYSFSHLTIQEYLTAQYISQKDSLVEELVDKYLTEKRWREVFLLIAGLKDDAGELLKLMEAATQQYINTPKLQNLLVWVERVTDKTTGYFQPLSKRAIAISCANANAKIIANARILAKFSEHFNHNAYFYANTIANADPNSNFRSDIDASAIVDANSVANVDIDVIIGIKDETYSFSMFDALSKLIDYVKWSEKLQIYQSVDYSKLVSDLEKLKQQIREQYLLRRTPAATLKASARQIIEIFRKAFNITSEIVDLSESELDALDNYLYANLLMVECKKAAVRVSKEVWNGIESRMLLPVREM